MQKQRGFSLLEAVAVSGIVMLIAIGSCGLLIATMRTFQYAGTQFSADMQTTNSIQQMAKDLQEAKQITLISASDMRVYYPQKVNGVYTGAMDNVNTLDYYRGDSAGNPDSTGSFLIRKPAGGASRTICKGVLNVNFTSPDPDSVDVTLQANVKSGSVTKECDMVHRAIFLRNY